MKEKRHGYGEEVIDIAMRTKGLEINMSLLTKQGVQ